MQQRFSASGNEHWGMKALSKEQGDEDVPVEVVVDPDPVAHVRRKMVHNIFPFIQALK